MKSAIERLLVRPLPLEGESWSGYLLRLTQENCLRSVHELSGVLGVSATALVRLGQHKGMALLNRQLATPMHETAMSIKDKPFASTAAYGRFCCMCLREHGDVFMARWDRPTAIICKEHANWLCDHCYRCGRPIDSKRERVDRCLCGTLYKYTHVVRVADWIFDLEDLFGIRVDGGDQVDNSPWTQQELSACTILHSLAMAIRARHWPSEPLVLRWFPAQRLTRADLNLIGNLSSGSSERLAAIMSRLQVASLDSLQAFRSLGFHRQPALRESFLRAQQLAMDRCPGKHWLETPRIREHQVQPLIQARRRVARLPLNGLPVAVAWLHRLGHVPLLMASRYVAEWIRWETGSFAHVPPLGEVNPQGQLLNDLLQIGTPLCIPHPCGTPPRIDKKSWSAFQRSILSRATVHTGNRHVLPRFRVTADQWIAPEGRHYRMRAWKHLLARIETGKVQVYKSVDHNATLNDTYLDVREVHPKSRFARGQMKRLKKASML